MRSQRTIVESATVSLRCGAPRRSTRKAFAHRAARGVSAAMALMLLSFVCGGCKKAALPSSNETDATVSAMTEEASNESVGEGTVATLPDAEETLPENGFAEEMVTSAATDSAENATPILPLTPNESAASQTTTASRPPQMPPTDENGSSASTSSESPGTSATTSPSLPPEEIQLPFVPA